MPDSSTTSTDTETSGSATGGADTEAEKTYTGKDLERIVKARLERERKTIRKQIEDDLRSEAVGELLEKYGLDDEAAIEKLVSGQGEGAKAQRAQAKVEKEMSKLRSQLEERDKTLESMKTVVRKTLVDNAIAMSCAGKCNDPEVAVALLSPRFTIGDDHKPVALDSDGNPTDLTPAALVDELLRAKPHLALPTGDAGAGSRVTRGAAAASDGKPVTKADRLAILAKTFGT